jgi:predicted MPP superfamily phosphohydrolase
MLSVETVAYADRADGTGRAFGEPTGGLLKRLLWRTANCCLLGGLLTWPLERDWVRVEALPMLLDNLGWEFDGARLAHLSDLHCGTLVREKHLQRYVEMVNSLDVDFAVITGGRSDRSGSFETPATALQPVRIEVVNPYRLSAARG